MQPRPRGNPWYDQTRAPAVLLFVSTFAILVFELALIRWVGTQIRVAAYFANLVLLAAFLGMGLGVGLGRTRPDLIRWALPALGVLALVVGGAMPLGLTHLRFPDPAISLWGGERAGDTLHFALAAVIVVSAFWAIATVFVFLGSPVGWLFDRLPPLRAYAVDLGGSLLGVVAMAVLASLWAPPAIWLSLGCAAVLWLTRDRFSIAAAIVVIVAAIYSVHGAQFSPYNRIDIEPFDPGPFRLAFRAPGDMTLSVNRDFHQFLLNLRENVTAVPMGPTDGTREYVRQVYELPFRFARTAKPTALVVGAGGGNDVAAALRRGFAQVVSVDIDPAILRAGQRLHPEQPYADPRVKLVTDDARAYFGRRAEGPRFDVVCYGLLDSHALFSTMSSLRLDNFVYTVEGIAAGWALVADDGVLSISFSTFAGEWMFQRQLRLIKKATGLDPIVFRHGYNVGATFLVGRALALANVQALEPGVRQDWAEDPAVRIPTDDWPFLYLRPRSVPWAYIAVFVLIGLTSLAAVRVVYGRTALGTGRFDPQMFLLGGAFLLLETRAVTHLSLLFGSTWVVNTAVFGGILMMVLAANLVVGRLQRYRRRVWYGLLAAALLGIWALPVSALAGFSVVLRVIVAGIVFAVPVFFAGIIFSSELRQRTDTAAALGCNLCGAVVGGLLENLSMLTGLKTLILLALGLYLWSMLAAPRRIGAAVPAAG